MALNIMTFSINDTQHNNTVSSVINYAEFRYAESHDLFIYCYAECLRSECRYAEFHYAECRCAECRGANFSGKTYIADN